MSKIDNLIKQLCPKGVECKKIGDICEISRGIVISKNYIQDNIGEYPVYSSQTEDNGCLGKIKTFAFEGEYLTWTTDGANAGTLFYRTGRFNITNVCGLLKVKDNAIYIKYLYYSLGIEAPKYVNNGMGNAKLMSNVMSNIRIPVPPFPVQEEIVRILDKMVEQQQTIEKLIELRKKQYEYYREELLKPKEGWVTVKISDLGTITRGRRFVRDDVRESGIPCIHYGDMYTYYGITTNTAKTFLDENFPKKMQYAKKGDVVVVGAGENDLDIGVGTVWEGEEPAAVHDACYILEHKQNPKYIAYCLRTNNYHQQLRKYVSEGKICSISSTGFGSVYISLPSMDKQQKIVDFLDNFETSIAVMTSVLAAIKARYAHYRDELLRF
jgi:type I restriction enzyme, S subunit